MICSFFTLFFSFGIQGLINAVAEMAPLATHRNCARQCLHNWKKSHKGVTLKNMFWRVVRSTYMEEYNEALDVLKKENLGAYEDFIGTDKKIKKKLTGIPCIHACAASSRLYSFLVYYGNI